MAKVSKSITVKAATENLSVVRHSLEEFALQCGANAKVVFDIQLAVDEAFTNIIKHAYQYDATKEVYLNLSFQNSWLKVELADKGRSFNPETYQRPNVESRIKQKKRGGVGVLLMTQLMDEVSYDHSGERNIITMAKHIA